eukprot:6609009-Prymnesium_polylepis.1
MEVSQESESAQLGGAALALAEHTSMWKLQIACISALASAKEVNSIPGLSSTPCWKQDAGYLPVSDGKQLYY